MQKDSDFSKRDEWTSSECTILANIRIERILEIWSTGEVTEAGKAFDGEYVKTECAGATVFQLPDNTKRLNYRTDLVFLYVTGYSQYPLVAARSAVVFARSPSAAFFSSSLLEIIRSDSATLSSSAPI